MRVHIPALPHTEITADYCWCAYSSKILKFANMMSALGHQVLLYGAGDHTEAECEEFVPVVTDMDRERWFGHYNWETDVFDGFHEGEEWWVVMNARVITEIKSRQQPGDLLGIIGGTCQRSIALAYPEMLPIEWGIGYKGVFAEHRVFESYAWMHYLSATRGPTDDVRLFDTVIPNYFDPADFNPRDGRDGEYLLYLGRLTPRKGLAVVQEVADRIELPVITAGQGVRRIKGAEHVGVVRGKEKADLLAGARALICPTTYLEPFGGVAVEAMLSGTPAISTDYGAFTETIKNGVSGFRCNTLAEFLDAVEQAANLPREYVRIWAQQYTLREVGPMYERYFERVMTRWKGGWYELG